MKMMTIKDAADVMRVSTKTVYRLVNAGKLKMIKIGRASRIAETDLAGYLGSLGYQGA